MTGRTRSLPFPEGPTLLGWTDAVPLGFVLPDAELKIGSALVSIPITIERPASGASIVVPSAFLPYRVVRGKYGPTPAVFVEDWRVWNSSSVPGTLPLVFRLPRELLPMRVEKAKFTLDITAPNAGVEIFVDRGGQLSSVDKRQAPDGAYEIQLTGDGLQPDARGDILVIFRVNYLTAGERTLWQVHRTALEVSGVVEPALP